MNMLTILRSVEDFLYEVMSWLLFYPRTLWMTLIHPLKTMRYSDQEQRDKPEKQYLETLSPPLFLVLSIILGHAAELAFGIKSRPGVSNIGRLVSQSDQTLLGFRALIFALPALVFAWVILHLQSRRVDRESLRAPFFAQCYLAGATAIVVSLASSAMRFGGLNGALAGMVVIVLATVWYLVVQWTWLRQQTAIGPARAAALTTVAFAGTMGVVSLVGFATV